MNAARDLAALIAGLSVREDPRSWRFSASDAPPDLTSALMAFREREGWTAISEAPPASPSGEVWTWLEIETVSDLHAVGFTAAFSAALAAQAIPCNVVAGLNHDHLFVPKAQTKAALAALAALKRGD